MLRSLLPPHSLAAASALILLATAGSHPAAAQVLGDPHAVKITHCAITKPRPFSHHPTGTQIAYTNTGPTVLHDITFNVGYRNGARIIQRTFDDLGTFGPNEPVNHHFAAFSDVDYTGAEPTNCSVTAVR